VLYGGLEDWAGVIGSQRPVALMATAGLAEIHGA